MIRLAIAAASLALLATTNTSFAQYYSYGYKPSYSYSYGYQPSYGYSYGYSRYGYGRRW